MRFEVKPLLGGRSPPSAAPSPLASRSSPAPELGEKAVGGLRLRKKGEGGGFKGSRLGAFMVCNALTAAMAESAFDELQAPTWPDTAWEALTSGILARFGLESGNGSGRRQNLP